MEIPKVQLHLLDSLIKNEEAISELYSIYAQRFPDYHQFWSHLVEDELDHAKWLNELYDKLEKNELYFQEDRFDQVAINLIMQEIQLYISQVKMGSISIEQALTRSLSVEEELVERTLFKVYEADTPIMKEILAKLEVSTEHHYQDVKNTLLKLHQKSTN